MTTGEPGTDAQVTNSGTEQNAVLDFTIPRGDTGTVPDVSLLSAYSTPAQGLASGGAITFDRNALSYGSDISHTAGGSAVTISQPGVYLVSFQGVISPTSGDTFPVSLVTSLTQDGAIVPGASVPYNFQSASDSSAQSFTVPISVTAAPSTLEVSATGGNYLADAVSLTVTRLGGIPS